MIQVAISAFLTEVDRFLTIFLTYMGYGCVCVCACLSEIGVLLRLGICLSTDGCLGTLFSDKSILAKLGGQLSTNTHLPSKVHFDKGCFVEEHVGDSS